LYNPVIPKNRSAFLPQGEVPGIDIFALHAILGKLHLLSKTALGPKLFRLP